MNTRPDALLDAAANLTDEDYRNIAARLATPSDDTRSEGREQVVVDRETWEYLVSNDTPSEGLRAAAQRVVAAFDNVTSQPEGYWSAEDDDALDALRAALSAPPQETVDTGFVPGMRFGNGDNVLSPQESPATPSEWPPLIRRTPSEEAAWHEGYAFGMKMAVAQSAPSTEETPQESPGIDVERWLQLKLLGAVRGMFAFSTGPADSELGSTERAIATSLPRSTTSPASSPSQGARNDPRAAG